jgi:hypothetical protein
MEGGGKDEEENHENQSDESGAHESGAHGGIFSTPAREEPGLFGELAY